MTDAAMPAGTEQGVTSAPRPRAESRPIIEIDRLTRTYRMGEHDVRALEAVDLVIAEGEYIAIVGPSGSGKSTLMYLLGCLDTPTSGRFRLRGREISSLDDRALSRVRNREIGFVFQQFHLLAELDVTENAGLGMTYAGVERAARRKRAASVAADLGLADRMAHHPTQLSGGQMQRVAIARALAGDPHLLLADEPTGNLDSRTSREILDVFRRLNDEGKTIVMVTHDARVAAEADRVVTLGDGRIVSDESARRDGAVTALVDPAADRGGAGPGLRLGDLMRIALREGLLAHKLRSFLTMLGIIFGIAAVIAMTAITEGGKRQQLDQLRQIGMNNIQVRDLDLEAARLLRQRRLNPRGVTVDDLEHLRRHVEGVEAVTAWKGILAELRHGSHLVEDARTLGVTGSFESVVNYYVAQGRFLEPSDEQEQRRVCVLGPAIADALGLGPEPLGRVVIIGDQPFVVVGLMEHKPFSESSIGDVGVVDRNRDVYVPYDVLRLYFRKDSKASELDVISLRMDSDERLLDRSKLIRYIVGQLHRGAEDFGVFVPLEKLKQARQTKDVFNVIIIVIAGISLIVGGIGIMNIMLATVTERTREIGIRRAIGASRRDTMAQFLAESSLIALFGGLLGIVTGLLGGVAIQQAFGFPVAFRPAIMVAAAVISMGVGVAFGLYPAWLAANKDPVEALRN
ncbi:MAG: hypothetical protein CMJ18_18215 [Phycisphaeraceae bacterium]|nr:hypothetical protein [Phycisphaeraceae bacterium]